MSVKGKSIAPLWNEPISGYLGIPDLKSDDLVTISYSVPRTITKEKIGGNNSGDGWGFGFCDPSDKIEYTITWVGNNVVDIEPQGKYLALFHSSD